MGLLVEGRGCFWCVLSAGACPCGLPQREFFVLGLSAGGLLPVAKEAGGDPLHLICWEERRLPDAPGSQPDIAQPFELAGTVVGFLEVFPDADDTLFTRASVP
jgi:hypothetical protein